MSEVVARLFAELGFEFDDRDLLKFKIGLAGAAAVVGKFANDTIKAVVGMDNFAKRTGISVEALQQWQDVAKLNNVNADAIASGLENIANAQAQIALGKGNLSPWALIGIDPRQDPLKVFDQIIEKIGDIRADLRTQVLGQLGLDPQLVNLIGQKRENGANQFAPSAEERQAVLELNQSFTELRITLGYLRGRFVASLTPLKNFFDTTRRIIELADYLVQRFIGWDRATKNLILTFGAVLAVLNPVKTAIVAVMFAVEDIYTYFQGGESFTGDFINALKNFHITLDGVKQAIMVVVTALTAYNAVKLGKKVLGIFTNDQASSAISKINKGVENVGTTAKRTTTSLMGMVAQVSSLIAAAQFAWNAAEIGKNVGEKLDETKAGQWVGDKLLSLKNWAQEGVQSLWENTKKEKPELAADISSLFRPKETTNENGEIAQIQAQSPVRSIVENRNNNQTSNASVSNNINNTNNFNINGAQSPQAVAQEIVNMQQQMNTAQLLFKY